MSTHWKIHGVLVTWALLLIGMIAYNLRRWWIRGKQGAGGGADLAHFLLFPLRVQHGCSFWCRYNAENKLLTSGPPASCAAHGGAAFYILLLVRESTPCIDYTRKSILKASSPDNSVNPRLPV